MNKDVVAQVIDRRRRSRIYYYCEAYSAKYGLSSADGPAGVTDRSVRLGAEGVGYRIAFFASSVSIGTFSFCPG